MTPASTDIQISIIIPVFNVGEYIEACLDSILEQDYGAAYEVILIEDCSNDNSRQLCLDYVEKHPEIFQLISHTENQGVSQARNHGLERMQGKYFMFVDPDDLLPTGSLTALYSAAETNHADIVKGNNTIFDENLEKGANYNVRKNTLVKNDAVLTELYRHRYVRGHPWGKLFLRSKLGAARFPQGVRMAQDLVYCSKVFAKAQTLVLNNQTVYRYRLRKSGSTGIKFSSGSYLHWLNSVEMAGDAASTQQQMNTHKDLQLRSLTQLARECRSIGPEEQEKVMKSVNLYLERWSISLWSIVFRYRLGPRSLFRYLKMKRAINQILATDNGKPA